MFKANNNVLLLIALFFTVVLIISFLGLQIIENQTREDTGKALLTVLKTTEEAHVSWIKHNKSILKSIANDPEITKLVKQLLNETISHDSLLLSKPVEQLRHHFDVLRETLNDIGFFIITKNNISAASMRDENLGIENLIALQYPEVLDKAFNGETIFVPPIHSDVMLNGKKLKNSSSLFFVTPIMDKGEVLALLSIRMLPNEDFTRISQIGRIGETGETYAFNQAGYMISNSRFNTYLHQIGLISKNDESILNIKITDPGMKTLENLVSISPQTNQPLTLMAKSAISGNAGTHVQGYRDYRGKNVLGAWLWNTDLNYGLTTEMDESEALKSYFVTRKIILSIVLVMIFLSLSLTYIIYLIEQTSKEKLKVANENLDLKIKDRTSELLNTNNELKETLDHLKKLQGIIPICGYCKSIRNDKGSWDLLESYLSQNTDAQFSHGICPSCLKNELEKIK